MKLLALDTATELCSVALWLDGRLHAREAARARGSGELLLPMIDELLKQADVGLAQLDAIAFGRGPGGFTGVRLAASVAQGLGFAAQLPLIAISDLRAVAAQALALPGAGTRALICQDARMAEVYWGCFELLDGAVQAHGAEAVAAPQRVALPADWAGLSVCGAGSGYGAYPAALSPLAPSLSPLWPQLRPRAREIAQLAAQDGLHCALAPEQAQPVYLRDEVALPAAPSSPLR
jgi:tRNA threonylcarbamoyladenosine biosynthesis protein TsaB